MASKEVYFRGKAHFFKLLGKGDLKYACWATGIYLDEASYNLYLELKKGKDGVKGIMNDVKITEDGYLINLKRPWTRQYQGKEVGFTAPVVIDNKNQPWPESRPIGNGSDITVKCEYYSFKPPFQKDKGSAIRLVSARIEDWIPYEPSRDFDEATKEATRGLVDQAPPKQYF